MTKLLTATFTSVRVAGDLTLSTNIKMIEFMYEHAARTFAYQQKAWFGRESKVFYDAQEKRWICHVLDEGEKNE